MTHTFPPGSCPVPAFGRCNVGIETYVLPSLCDGPAVGLADPVAAAPG